MAGISAGRSPYGGSGSPYYGNPTGTSRQGTTIYGQSSGGPRQIQPGASYSGGYNIGDWIDGGPRGKGVWNGTTFVFDKPPNAGMAPPPPTSGGGGGGGAAGPTTQVPLTPPPPPEASSLGGLKAASDTGGYGVGTGQDVYAQQGLGRRVPPSLQALLTGKSY